MKSHRALFFLAFTLILLAGIVIVGFSRGWFERQPEVARTESNDEEASAGQENESERKKPRRLSDVLGVEEDDLAIIGGVKRQKKNAKFADPPNVDYGEKNPLPFAGLPGPVKDDTNVYTKALAKDLRNETTRRAASSMLAELEEFDLEKYRQNPEAYLTRTRPARVNQTAEPGEGVIPLKADSSEFIQVLRNESVVVRARGTAHMPITFHSNQYGTFENGLKTISVAFDDEGIAKVVFKTGPGSQGIVKLLAGSPVHSGRLTYASYDPVEGGAPEIDDTVSTITPEFTCGSVMCMIPPVCICDDKFCNVTSAFSLPPELAGRKRTTDYRASRSSAGGCSTCSGGGADSNSALPSLDITRLLMPSDLDTQGSSAPGNFFSHDYRLKFVHSESAFDCVFLFDPDIGRELYFDDFGQEQPPFNYHNKVVTNANYAVQHIYKGIESNTNVNPTMMTAERSNGWKYEFALPGGPEDEDYVAEGRLTRIIDPNGNSINFGYQLEMSEPDAALRQKVDTISDAYGMQARIGYAPNQLAASYVIDQIEIFESAASQTPITTIAYGYDGSQLISVSRDSIVIASYEYGTDNADNETVTFVDSSGSVPQVQVMHLSPNYFVNNDGIAASHAGILQGVSDGKGIQYLTITQPEPTTGRYEINYRGRQMRWSPGQYLRYMDGGNYEEFYAGHPLINLEDGLGGNEPYLLEAITGQPSRISTESGMLIDVEYDDLGNVTLKEYLVDAENGVESHEEWVYDDQSNELAYRDRRGYVTLTERDSAGNPTRVVRGLVESGNDLLAAVEETVAPNTVPLETQYKYFANGQMEWSANVEFTPSAGPPDEDAKTFYHYDTAGRLDHVVKPTPPGSPSVPTVYYTWTNGDLTKVTNELTHDNEFLYDAIGRLILTTYEDGTTEAVRFTSGDTSSHSALHFVDRKNRKGVVQRATYDNAGRMASQIAAFAIDNGYLSDETVWAVNSGGQSLLPATESPRSEYAYLPGQTQRQTAKQNGGITTYFYDYRGRNDLMLTMANESHCVHDAQTYAQNRLFMTERRIGLLQGDLNLDGTVNLLDIDLLTSLLSGDFGELPPFLAEAIADMNGDGMVDLLDVTGFIKSLSGSGNTPVVARSYNVYNASEQHVRIVRSANLAVSPYPDGTEDINEFLLLLARPNPTDPDPDFVIEDAVRDSIGNQVEVMDGLGTIQRTEFDGVGRQIRRISDLTGAGLTSETRYDSFGNVSETENIDTGLKTAFDYQPDICRNASFQLQSVERSHSSR